MINGFFCVGEKLILSRWACRLLSFSESAHLSSSGNHGLFVMSQRAHPYPTQVSDRPHPELGFGSALVFFFLIYFFYLLPKHVEGPTRLQTLLNRQEAANRGQTVP